MTKVRSLSLELQQKAQVEIYEDANTLIDNLKHIKKWLQENNHMFGKNEDQLIATFLRGCKHNISNTKLKLEMFYKSRENELNIFKNRNPKLKNIQQVLEAGMCIPLPKRANPSGPTVIICRSFNYNPNSIELLCIIKVMFMYIEFLMLNDDNYTVCGHHLILDLKDIPYKYIFQLTPSLIKYMVDCVQNIYPLRLKGLHFINTPFVFKAIINIAKNFLSTKLAERIHVYCGDEPEYLDTSIPISILPVEYGGMEVSVDILTEEWKEKIENFSDWYIN